MALSEPVVDCVLGVTGAAALRDSTVVQVLWSGYGEIVRCQLDGGPISSVIVKHVKLSGSWSGFGAHPRGWNTDRSHQRKMKSYVVESAWYQHWAHHCDDRCRVPGCLSVSNVAGETVIVMEDLDAAGFPARSLASLKPCLQWLAHFHATFLGVQADDLWQQGTYWHLATRPDELAALADARLRAAAPAIDARLEATAYRTLVHGDAKLANFVFLQTAIRQLRLISNTSAMAVG